MRRKTRWILAAVAAIILLVAGLYVYDYIRLNLWIDRDAGRLEDYPIYLIRDHIIQDSHHSTPDADRYDQIDSVLVEELSNKRNVVNLSRQPIKLNLLRTRAYAKVFLETAAPDDPDLRSSLQLVCEFKRGPNGWELAGPPKETTLE